MGIQAVDRFRKDLRTAGLARTAGAGEQVGMAHVAADELGFQRLRHSLLPNYIVKGLRTVFSI